ncbi:MAG: RdgB/HAM1 family non-canonical purine NTP pyrophosphatase [Lentisphaerae bacterium]|nr:RdgB/HAM1 family non-canonical purine NTP pyrophosphatase [Lentisphaerota bacterium]MCP4100034.1 RdgB/HAM1 family non-canonical purine NTP pyrophosphatase [Lentisphaerota bacterium]
MAQLVAATYNMHKLEEYKELLADQNIEIVSLNDYSGYEEPEENGKNFAENASIKALEAANYCDTPSFADDSGLEVEALDNAPGIYSARYAENDEARIARILKELGDNPNRRARFVCVIAIAANGEVIETFRGEVNGVIIDAPRGDNGFGYDPIFLPDGYDKTFAELSAEEKNKISHRAKAVAKAIGFVEEEMGILDDEFDDF